MATIEETNSQMTLFYNKRTGEIKNTCTGAQDMSIYGEEQQDYALIWDYTVLARDDSVLRNPRMFKINVSTKQIEIKPDGIPKYPIAN